MLLLQNLKRARKGISKEGFWGFERFCEATCQREVSSPEDQTLAGLLGPRRVVKGSDAEVWKETNCLKSGWGKKQAEEEIMHADRAVAEIQAAPHKSGFSLSLSGWDCPLYQRCSEEEEKNP